MSEAHANTMALPECYFYGTMRVRGRTCVLPYRGGRQMRLRERRAQHEGFRLSVIVSGNRIHLLRGISEEQLSS